MAGEHHELAGTVGVGGRVGFAIIYRLWAPKVLHGVHRARPQCPTVAGLENGDRSAPAWALESDEVVRHNGQVVLCRGHDQLVELIAHPAPQRFRPRAVVKVRVAGHQVRCGHVRQIAKRYLARVRGGVCQPGPYHGVHVFLDGLFLAGFGVGLCKVLVLLVGEPRGREGGAAPSQPFVDLCPVCRLWRNAAVWIFVPVREDATVDEMLLKSAIVG